MKTLFTFALGLLFIPSIAADKTTVGDGNWFDPANWSPAGVPLMEDVVIINHDITTGGGYVEFAADWLIVSADASITSDTIFALHGNLRLFGLMDIQILAIGDGDSTNVYGTVTGEKFVPGNPTNINFGSILSDTLICGDYFENYGLINTDDLTSGGPAFENRSGAEITVSGMCLFAEYVNNESNASIQAGDLVTEGIVVNDGEIATTNWTHGSGTASGTSGKFCIAACFINADEISGTVDVCDATPAGFCDFNFGTIASSVTLCDASPCGAPAALESISADLSIYPNPTSNHFSVHNAPVGSSLQLYNLQGESIYSLDVLSTDAILIDVSEFEKGIYLLRLKNGEVVSNFRIVVS